ncbi:hypothetical protein BOW43_09145 [Solemya velum gill symbiont]|nr:hypothetical protein BOW43_09145 [Solemya velum gill symbiont]
MLVDKEELEIIPRWQIEGASLRASRIQIANFRGIRSATLVLPRHAVLIGDNNTGKTTILEALDLALGPDRLNRVSSIDEHDFYQGHYIIRNPVVEEANAEEDEDDAGENQQADEAPMEAVEEKAPQILIEVTIVDLSDEQKGRFGDYIEFWDSATDALYIEPNPEGIDEANITEALRVRACK